MEWYYQAAIILIPAAIVFRLFRRHITPLKRMMTWLVCFFIILNAVQAGNNIIERNNYLPVSWGHLPLQAIATSILLLYVPVREEKPGSEDDAKKAKGADNARSSSAKSKRRFKKK